MHCSIGSASIRSTRRRGPQPAAISSAAPSTGKAAAEPGYGVESL